MTVEDNTEFMKRLEQFRVDQVKYSQQMELLHEVSAQPHRKKNEQEAIGWGMEAVSYLFSEEIEIEEGFLQEHVSLETKQPNPLENIEHIIQWTSCKTYCVANLHGCLVVKIPHLPHVNSGFFLPHALHLGLLMTVLQEQLS